MINTVSFERLDLVRLGKDENGMRHYLKTPIGEDLLAIVQRCVRAGVFLTK